MTTTPSPFTTLPVYYPFGGRRCIMHWWTYDLRGHIAIARDERSLLAMAVSIFEEHPNAEIKAMTEIEIVGPSKKLEHMAAVSARGEAVLMFHHMICASMDDVLKDGRELPPPFARCEKYAPQSYMNEKDIDEFTRERHLFCENCYSRIVLVGMTPVEFHDRYADAWYARHPEHRFEKGVDRRRVPSRATSARDDDASIWYAAAQFGDHAPGIELRPVDPEAFRWEDNVLFFFKRLRELDVTKPSAVLRAAKEALEAERQRREDADKRARAEHERRQLDELVDFFRTRSTRS